MVSVNTVHCLFGGSAVCESNRAPYTRSSLFNFLDVRWGHPYAAIDMADCDWRSGLPGKEEWREVTMSSAFVADAIFVIFMVLTLILGLRAAQGEKLNLAEWSIGGRKLGALFIWFLMGGEIYTSFSYLGTAGWGYAYGVPIYYQFANLACGYALGYFVGPLLWNYARKYDLISVSDIAAHRFRSRFMGICTAIIATVFLLPYIQLQLTGIGAVLTVISEENISTTVAYVIAFVVSVGFVVVSGLRGSAWVSVLKDILVIVTMIIMGIYIPYHYFGGYSGLFDKLIASRPEWLTLPGHSQGLGISWFITTGLLNSIGYTVFPNYVAGTLSARDPNVIRRNSIFLPFYQILLFVPMLLGMAALFIVPNLHDSNLALLAMIKQVFPGWMIGLIGAAAALSAIVPMTMYMLVIGTMLAKNVFYVRSDQDKKRVGQLITLVTGLIALIMAIFLPSTLVRLSVLSYEGISQLAPALILGLLWPRMNAKGAFSGLAVGVVVDAILVFSKHDPWYGINAGLIALVLNVIVNVVVSAVTTKADMVSEVSRMLVKEGISH